MTVETPTIRSIHYLGSKLRMLEAIKESVDEVVTGDGAICDLFSDLEQYQSIFCNTEM